MTVRYSRADDDEWERQKERPVSEQPRRGLRERVPGPVVWYSHLLTHPFRTYREDTARRETARAGRGAR